jgi:hypothetical protein
MKYDCLSQLKVFRPRLEYNPKVRTNKGITGRNSILTPKDIGVLILAYQRTSSLIEILQKCKENGFMRIYVSVDGPRNQNIATLSKSEAVMEILRNFEASYSGKISYKIAAHNLGCGVSVLSGCDWLYSQEEFGIIIEDDCIPSDDFFKFVLDNLALIDISTEYAVLGGTQFYRQDRPGSIIYKVKYPIFWGWATTRKQWELSRTQLDSLLNGGSLAFKGHSFLEKVYWTAGCRRILEGYVDTWDTLLTSIFINENRSALVPSQSLIQNVGNDEVATHTSGGTTLHNLPLGNYDFSEQRLIQSGKDIDMWMMKKIYKISWRHLFTTNLTKLLDRMFSSRAKLSPLSERYISA